MRRQLTLIHAFFFFVPLLASLSLHEVSAQSINWMHLSSSTGALPIPNGGLEQTASLVFDVDKNGTDDFIICERTIVPSVVWYRRTGNGWTKGIIDLAALHVEAGGAHYDIDDDGDEDIVFGGDHQSNQVWWWENPYPNYTLPWTRHLIKNGGSPYHHDELFGDFDGDGKVELVFWNQGSRNLYMAQIPANPRTSGPWTYTSIFSHANDATIHEGLAADDIDNDGRLDIIGGGRWFKHAGGTNFTVEVIDNTQKFTRAAVGQLKRGGRPEVVFSAGDLVGTLTYHEWNGSSWTRRDLVGVDHGHSLQIADINNDGNLDIFSAEMRLNANNPNAKMRIFYGDGRGNFTLSEVATGIGNHESRVGDLDGDSDLDILTKPYDWNTPRVDVWLNNGIGTTPPFALNQWQRHVIDENKPWRAVFITSADMDNDGKKDIITGGWWYRNPGSATGAWSRITIGSPLNNMALVFDFDNNGSMDVLGTKGQAANPNAEFVWAKNNGSGSFTILTNVTHGDGDFLQGVATTRFKPGDPLEVLLSWHIEGKGIQSLTVPADPSSGTWAWRRISATSQDEQISVADLERNGLNDVIMGTQWLRNDGTAFTPLTLNPSSGSPDRNRLADINRDGRIDVVVGYEAIGIAGKLAWYEQPASATTLWAEHIISTSVIGPMSLDVADMDNDGDIDVVVGEHNLAAPSTAKLMIFQNTDGTGGSWNSVTVYTGDEHHDGAQVVDIDNDGDLDIISIGWDNPRVTLYENRAIVSSVVVRTSGSIPAKFALRQNYPNPFNPTTQIAFTVPSLSFVTLKISDTLGKEVATLVDRRLEPGEYQATFEAKGLSSGIYFYTFTAGTFAETKKMLLIR